MSYEQTRQRYQPDPVKWLLIAESPPPDDQLDTSTRHFYRVEAAGDNDRLFNNTVRAVYDEQLAPLKTAADKAAWLQRLKGDGFYMIEALTQSQPHEAKTSERQKALKEALPDLIERVKALASPDTKIILIKSNPFKICAEPLRASGFNVLNTETVNYPGYWQEQAFRTKLRELVAPIKKEPL